MEDNNLDSIVFSYLTNHDCIFDLKFSFDFWWQKYIK